MPTRRQEKVSRIVQEVVSDAITNHLNDPRIDGFVSVTRVDMTPNLRRGDVYLSVFGKNQTAQNKTFEAIKHSKSRIQSLLASKLQSRVCPILHFYKDEKFKKTIEILNLIEKVVGHEKKDDSPDQPEQ